MVSSWIETKVDALLAVLDEEIRQTETTLSQLDLLRSLLIKRDDEALEQLLHALRQDMESRAAGIERRESLRAELAAELGCDSNTMTLSALKNVLSGARREAVAQRQARLKTLVAQLKREYALTTALLADCTRFNRSLMEVFFGPDVRVRPTYNARGAVKPASTTSLMNLHY